jgi:hypothetical protein
MNTRNLALALALAIGLAGCANGPMGMNSGSSSSSSTGEPTRLQSRMCQVFRSYEDRSAGGELQEACNRQLGAEMCARCMASGF